MTRIVPTILAITYSTSLISGLHAQQPVDLTRLESLLDEASFVAVSDKDITDSRASLLMALGDVPIAAEVKSEDWENLRTESVSQALTAKSEHIQEHLAILLDKLNQVGLPHENPKLLKLRSLVTRHLMRINDHAKRNEIEATFVRTRIEMLDALGAFERSGSSFQYRRLASGIQWFDDHELASQFVQATKRKLSIANLEIRLPAPLVRRATKTPLEKNEPINRNADGTITRGTVELRANGFLEPGVSSGNGALVMRIQGNANWSLFNRRGEIQFSSYANTYFSAGARITLDSKGLMKVSGVQPQVGACTHLRNCRATVKGAWLFGPLIGHIADRTIAHKTPAIAGALSCEVVNRLRTEFEEKLQEVRGQANSFVRKQFIRKAHQLDLYPSEFSVQTTNEELRLTAIMDAQGGLAAPRPCAAPADGSGYASLHESLATDFLNAAYTRRTGTQKTLNANVIEQLNNYLKGDFLADAPSFLSVATDVPKFTVPDEPSLKLKLDFPRPFAVAFDQNEVRLTIRAADIVLEGSSHHIDYDVTVAYRVSQANSGGDFKFDLQEEMKGKSLVSKRDGKVDDSKDKPELEAAIRAELIAGLPVAFTVKTAVFSDGDFPLALQIGNFECQDGWLVISVGGPKPKADKLPSSLATRTR